MTENFACEYLNFDFQASERFCDSTFERPQTKTSLASGSNSITKSASISVSSSRSAVLMFGAAFYGTFSFTTSLTGDADGTPKDWSKIMLKFVGVGGYFH